MVGWLVATPKARQLQAREVAEFYGWALENTIQRIEKMSRTFKYRGFLLKVLCQIQPDYGAQPRRSGSPRRSYLLRAVKAWRLVHFSRQWLAGQSRRLPIRLKVLKAGQLGVQVDGPFR